MSIQTEINRLNNAKSTLTNWMDEQEINYEEGANLTTIANTIADIKPYHDTVPINSIFEYDGESVPDGYVEVPDPNVFSTTEKVVGTWIDGRTLYQRTWTYTTTEADTRYYLAAYGLTDIKDVWIVDSASYVRYGTGNGASTQSVNTWVSTTDYKLCYIDANGRIVMKTGTGGSTNALNWVITLRYTRV